MRKLLYSYAVLLVLTACGGDTTESPLNKIDPAALKKSKPHTDSIVLDTAAAVVYEEKLDTVEPGENEQVHSSPSPKKKSKHKKVSAPKPVSGAVNSDGTDKRIFNDTFYPLTTEEAYKYSSACYRYALRLRARAAYDSVGIIALRGNKIFENASLYYLKAVSDSAAGKYSAAVNGCKTAVQRNDFWGGEMLPAYETMIGCLENRLKEAPSELLRKHLAEVKETYESKK